MGRILIHASKQLDADAMAEIRSWHDVTINEIEFGGIIGSVEIIDCVQSDSSRWFYGPYGFKLARPERLPFIPMRGRLGIFQADKKEFLTFYRKASEKLHHTREHQAGRSITNPEPCLEAVPGCK